MKMNATLVAATLLAFVGVSGAVFAAAQTPPTRRPTFS
jgi:hypothetical protein